jgi:DNA-binding transcriptional LysR family regulator
MTIGEPSSPRDLLDVRALCLACDLGCLTAAARALGESKGSVSRRIARLERSLGLALLHRGPRSVRPTAAGAAYRAEAARALEVLDRAAARAGQARSEPAGLLRVTAVQALGELLAPIVRRFGELHPAVSVDLLLTDEVLDLERERLDAALRCGRRLPDSALRAVKLAELRDVLVASPAYLRRHPAPERAEDLERHRLVLPLCRGKPRGPVPIPLTDAAGRTSTVRISGAIRSNDAGFLRAAALDGAGIALVPSHLAARELAAGSLVQVLADRTIAGGRLFFVHRPGPYLSPQLEALRDHLVEAFRGRGERRRAAAAR